MNYRCEVYQGEYCEVETSQFNSDRNIDEIVKEMTIDYIYRLNMKLSDVMDEPLTIDVWIDEKYSARYTSTIKIAVDCQCRFEFISFNQSNGYGKNENFK